MLGDARSPECAALMRLIETQSMVTLAAWAVSYAKANYLLIYHVQGPGDARLDEAVRLCESYLNGEIKKNEIKSALRGAARGLADARARSRSHPTRAYRQSR